MRLIDANRLSEVIYDNVSALYEDAVCAKEDCLTEIYVAPTVDAVPDVRCAKCEHWVKNDDGQYVCALFDIANSYGEPVVTKPDDFCSYGKRKGGAD